ncbi:gliding motility-associated C-terminal domain-containing protein [Algoriphagus sp. AK58]|uniref:T9SS type B sorting domain-containing protein n=1 Tax=Algoriphagus sp. AK58 TaxID=1406877 RepID=UPI00164F3A49|nr:gliding motility-associated C-terminal domain-containing protein [Algoriphagus sp. AK58]MBC6365443.1 hypothetical protein [Algoriphagus sp. AK58]
MKAAIQIVSFLILLLVLHSGTNTSAQVFHGNNLTTAQIERSTTVPPFNVQVSGKLALCSHSEKGNIILTVSGGKAPYTFKWNTNETTQNRNNLNAGTYTVEITDSNGIRHIERIVIQPPFPLILNPVEKRDASCGSGNNGYAKISVKMGRNDYEKDSPPYKVTWSNGLKDVWEANNLAPGTYTVLVEDKYNCSVSISFDIKSGNQQGFTVTENIENPSCQNPTGGKITLNVAGGEAPYTFKWSSGATTKDLIGLSPGIYQVQIQDNKGCFLQKTFSILAPSSLELEEKIVEPSCQGSSNGFLEVNPTGGKPPYSYLWNTGNTGKSLSNLAAGTYSVKVIDANGCSLEKQFSLVNQSTLNVKVLEVRPVSCSGGADGFVSVEIKGAKGKPVVKWSDGSAPNLLRNDLKAGTYTIEVTDESGCKITTPIQIQEFSKLQARIETAFEMDCKNGKLIGKAWVSIQGGKAPYNVNWNTNSTNAREISFESAGVLRATVTDALGCSIIAEEKVDYPNQNTLNSRLDFQYRKLTISNDPEVLVNEEIIFESEISPEIIAWEWDFGDGNKSTEKDPVHIFDKPGKFEVKLTGYDMYGCSTFEINSVLVNTPEEMMVIPNAFSPNGDGLNDVFKPKMKGINEINLEIFNSWGEKIHISSGIESTGWDGTYKGQILPAGNFIYKVTYVTWENVQKTQTGGVTLIR